MQKDPAEDQYLKKLEFSEKIRQQSYKKFNELFKKKFKKQYQNLNIYTVICSLSIINKVTNNLEIVALANGTKSLPYSIYALNKTYLLKDMHAQILVIKAFRRFILNQICKNDSPYFILDPENNKFSFDKSKFEIVLFSSQPFCGDCSINQQQQLFSGSKPLKYFDLQNLPNQKFQKHVLRTKPGRVDLPQNKKSLSLSCSDKLALYNILGIQGKQLFHKVKPIYIDFFVVQSQKNRLKSIQQGANFVYRLQKLRNQSEEAIDRKIFHIIIEGKVRKISNQFKLNNPQVICLDAQIVPEDQIKSIEGNLATKKKEKEGFEVSLIYSNEHFEWVNSKTGLPQGCSLSNYMKKGKVSFFCKKSFLEQLSNQEMFIDKKFDQKQQTFKYSAIKDRIKLLFGIWTDFFKSQTQGDCKENS